MDGAGGGRQGRHGRGLARLATLAYAGVIALQSSFALPAVAARPPLHLDKLIHGVEFAVLGWLACKALAGRRGAWLLAALAAALFGLTDEWHQSFVPGRDASVGDAIADAVGSVIGAWAARGRVPAAIPPAAPARDSRGT